MDIHAKSRLEPVRRNTTLARKPAKRGRNRMKIWRVPDTKCTEGIWRGLEGLNRGLKGPKSDRLVLRSLGSRSEGVEIGRGSISRTQIRPLVSAPVDSLGCMLHPPVDVVVSYKGIHPTTRVVTVLKCYDCMQHMP